MRRFQFTLSSLLIATSFFAASAATWIGWRPAWQEERTIKASQSESALYGLIVSPDGRFLLTQESRERSVDPPRIWNVETGNLVSNLPPNTFLGNAQFSADGSKLFDCDYSGGIFWDTATGAVGGSFGAHGSGFGNSGMLSPDCSRIVSYATDTTPFTKPAATLNPASSTPPNPAGLSTNPATATPAPPPAKRIPGLVIVGGKLRRFAGSPDDQAPLTKATLSIWDTLSGKELLKKDFTNNSWQEPEIQWAGDSKRLFVMGHDAVTIIDAQTMRELGVLKLEKPAQSFHLSKDGSTLLVSTEEDHELYAWDTNAMKSIGMLEAATAPGRVAALSPDGKSAITIAEEGMIRLWDIATCTCRGELSNVLAQRTSDVAFSSDSAKFALASMTGTVRLYNTFTGEHVGGFSFPIFSGMHNLKFLPNDRMTLISGKYIYIYRYMPGQWWKQLFRIESWIAIVFGLLFFSRVWAFLTSLFD